MKQTRIWILVAILGFGFLTTLLISSGQDKRLMSVSKNFEILFSIFRELNLHHVDSIPTDKMFEDGIDKMLAMIDPYTNYISSDKVDDFRTMNTGEYGGIGSMIQKQGEYVMLSEPYEGKPAHLAGLKAGDIILEIDGKSMKGKSMKEVSDNLKGAPQTVFKIRIERPGEKKPMDFTVTRDAIVLNPVSYYTVLPDGVGYISLTQFTTHAADETRKALVELKKQGATSLIFDLRGNGGGSLDEAIDIVNYFVPKGSLVVSTRGKIAQHEKKYFARKAPLEENMPMVVLTDSRSASASEIVSGALQDYDRAVIVGNRTFGKGLVQMTRPLPHNSQLKLTTAKYYIPSGRCIQAVDYSNRNEDGSVGKIPDSLMREFKTSNGRIVKDGGGITPDVEVKYDGKMGAILIKLYQENYFFDFATQYTLEHEKIAPATEFTLSEEDYEQFKAFVKERGFSYDPECINLLGQLEKAAKEERSYEKSKDLFQQLRTQLKHDIEVDLDEFKKEIIELLDSHIITRYYFRKGAEAYALRDDEGVKAAVKILKDPADYQKILTGGKLD